MTPTKKIQQELEPFLYSLDDWKDYIRKVTKNNHFTGRPVLCTLQSIVGKFSQHICSNI